MIQESDRRSPAPPPFGQRFWPLAVLGLIGVATLPLVIRPALLAMAARHPELSLFALGALSLIQPVVLVVAGAAVGAALAHRLGLTSHIARVNVRAPFAGEVPLAIPVGVVTGIVIVALDRWLFRGSLGTPLASAVSAKDIAKGLIAGATYGGLSEEVMMRWGLMSLVVWAGARLFAGTFERQPAAIYRAALVIVAALFAAGHLPAAAAVAPLDLHGVTRVLVLNALAGLALGWLYWRRSLEAAMVAHASVHVVFAVARALRWA